MVVPPFDYKAALQACAQGDQNALKSLYGQEAPRMLALSMQMLAQHDEAQDAVRDAFVLIWKNAENHDESKGTARRSEEHTSELQSLMRNSYAVFCLKKKNNLDQ